MRPTSAVSVLGLVVLALALGNLLLNPDGCKTAANSIVANGG